MFIIKVLLTKYIIHIVYNVHVDNKGNQVVLSFPPKRGGSSFLLLYNGRLVYLAVENSRSRSSQSIPVEYIHYTHIFVYLVSFFLFMNMYALYIYIFLAFKEKVLIESSIPFFLFMKLVTFYQDRLYFSSFKSSM